MSYVIFPVLACLAIALAIRPKKHALALTALFGLTFFGITSVLSYRDTPYDTHWVTYLILTLLLVGVMLLLTSFIIWVRNRIDRRGHQNSQ